MVVVGFFLPWMKTEIMGTVEKTNGLRLLIDSIKEVKDAGDLKIYSILMAVALGAMALTGLMAFIDSISTSFLKNDYNFFKYVPIVSIIGMAILLRVFFGELGFEREDIPWRAILDSLHTGFYISFVGAIILGLAKSKT